MTASVNDVTLDVLESLCSIERDLFDNMAQSYAEKKPFRWPVVSQRLISSVWESYVKTGNVPDDGRFEAITHSIRDSVLCLRICTILAGHTAHDPMCYFDEQLASQEEADKLYQWIARWAPSPPISDYGLDPLFDTLTQALCVDTRDMGLRLKLIDRMLNFTHQRGDLSALLVEGGRTTTNTLADIDADSLAQKAYTRERLRTTG